ncbi:hypothetical protein OWR29_20950 [Actinoplanes sp. Pm04-4]|uniref:Uncharacterized protein n=1 Tax=Paractinoplanes pyxinae TaxID=2997416 RepID=A0ABT4B4D2_9ACTN|nr:hypothetical protein [Actinoplanes pyxinae]MCY1140473.1 hypothetical protein [Actinoplanes pyxinae]
MVAGGGGGSSVKGGGVEAGRGRGGDPSSPIGGGGGGGDSGGGSPGGGGAGASHVIDPVDEPVYASNDGDGQLSITAAPGSGPAPTPIPTTSAPPGPVTLTLRTVGALRVASIWKVEGNFSAPLRSYAWLRCTALDATNRTPIAGAAGATYRTRPADLARFVAVDVVDANGNKGRSEPRHVLENVCEVPIEFNDGSYCRTRSRAATAIKPRPGWGCLRINMYIAAKRIDLLGFGNDRGASPRPTRPRAKGSIWVDLETGRVDVAASHTGTVAALFNAYPATSP